MVCFIELEEAKAVVVQETVCLECNRSRRDPDYEEALQLYLPFTKAFRYVPSDKQCVDELRYTCSYSLRASSCTFMLCLEGKEKPWCDACVESHQCSCEGRLFLLQLTSGSYHEWIAGSKVLRWIDERAQRRAASKKDTAGTVVVEL